MFVDSLFKGEIFYLDPKAFSNSVTVAEIEKNVQLLGGKIEKFMCKDVTCVVSDRKEPSKNVQTGVKDGLSPHSTASPMSRGQALLLKAQNSGSKNCTDILMTAKQLGIKVLDAKYLVTKIQEQLEKCNPNGRWEHARLSKKKTQCTKKIRAISGNYVKFEHESWSFRPVYGRFNKFPILFFHDDYEGSPFDAEPKKPVPSKHGTPAAQQDIKVSSKYSNSPRPHSSKQKPKRNLIPKPKSGYCESCELHFNDLNHHVKSKPHLDFIADKENFASLDKYLSDLPSVSDLVGNVSGDYQDITLEKSLTHSYIPDEGNIPSVDVENSGVGYKQIDAQQMFGKHSLSNPPTEVSPCHKNKHIFGEAFSNKTPSFSTPTLFLNEDSAKIHSSLTQDTETHNEGLEILTTEQSENGKLYRRLFDTGGTCLEQSESQDEKKDLHTTVSSRLDIDPDHKILDRLSQSQEAALTGTGTITNEVGLVHGAEVNKHVNQDIGNSQQINSMQNLLDIQDTHNESCHDQLKTDKAESEFKGQCSEGLSEKGLTGYNISYSDISHPDMYQQGNVSHYNISSFLDNWQPLSSKLDTIIENVISDCRVKEQNGKDVKGSELDPGKELEFQHEGLFVSEHDSLVNFNNCVLQPELLQQNLPSEMSGLVTSHTACTTSYTAESGVATDRVFSDISECNTSQGNNHHIVLSNSDIANVTTMKHSTSLTENKSSALSALTSNHLESSQVISSSKSCSLGPPELSIQEPVPNNIVEYSEPPQLSVCVPILSEHSVSGSTQFYDELESIPEMPVLDAVVVNHTDSSSDDSSSTLCSLSTHSSSESQSSDSSMSSIKSGKLFGPPRQVMFKKCSSDMKTRLMEMCSESFRRILTPKRGRQSSKLGTSDIGRTCTEEQSYLCTKMSNCSLTRETDTALDILKQLCDNFMLPESQEHEVKCDETRQTLEYYDINRPQPSDTMQESEKSEQIASPKPSVSNSFQETDINAQGSTLNDNSSKSEELDKNTAVDTVINSASSLEECEEKQNGHVCVITDVKNVNKEATDYFTGISDRQEKDIESQVLASGNISCENQSLDDVHNKHEYSFISESDTDSRWNTNLKLTCDNILNKLDTDLKVTDTDSTTGKSSELSVKPSLASYVEHNERLCISHTELANQQESHALSATCSPNVHTTDADIENNYTDFSSLQTSIATVLKESMQLVDGAEPIAEDCFEVPNSTDELPEFSHQEHLPDMYVSPNITMQDFDPFQNLQNAGSNNKSLPFKKRHLMFDLPQENSEISSKKKKIPAAKGRKRTNKTSEKSKANKKVYSSKVPFSMKKASIESDISNNTNVLPMIDESSCDSAVIDVCGISDEDDSTLDRTLVAVATDSQNNDRKRHFPISDVTNIKRDGQIFPRMDSFESSCSMKSASSGYVSEIHSSNEINQNVPKKKGNPKKTKNKENKPELTIQQGKKRGRGDTEIDGSFVKKWKVSVSRGASLEDKMSSAEATDTEWAIKPLGGLKLKLSRMSSYETSGSEQADEEMEIVKRRSVSSLKVSFKKTENQDYSTEVQTQGTHKHAKAKRRKSAI